MFAIISLQAAEMQKFIRELTLSLLTLKHAKHIVKLKFDTQNKKQVIQV
jgi:hypothetical protein